MKQLCCQGRKVMSCWAPNSLTILVGACSFLLACLTSPDTFFAFKLGQTYGSPRPQSLLLCAQPHDPLWEASQYTFMSYLCLNSPQTVSSLRAGAVLCFPLGLR